jgi:hypothetical protein
MLDDILFAVTVQQTETIRFARNRLSESESETAALKPAFTVQ